MSSEECWEDHMLNQSPTHFGLGYRSYLSRIGREGGKIAYEEYLHNFNKLCSKP
jgi:hypothetical protein